MRTIRNAALVVLLLLGSGASAADKATTDAAFELMDVLQLKALLAETIEQSTAAEIEKNPALGPYRQVFLDFMNKHMGYDSIKADLATMYAEAFTAQELKQLVAFYQTPVGRKSIQKMPELMAKGGQYGEQKVRDNIGELQTMIAEEAKRLQSLQGK
jgi:hypothetical protein